MSMPKTYKIQYNIVHVSRNKLPANVNWQVHCAPISIEGKIKSLTFRWKNDSTVELKMFITHGSPSNNM